MRKKYKELKQILKGGWLKTKHKLIFVLIAIYDFISLTILKE